MGVNSRVVLKDDYGYEMKIMIWRIMNMIMEKNLDLRREQIVGKNTTTTRKNNGKGNTEYEIIINVNIETINI